MEARASRRVPLHIAAAWAIALGCGAGTAQAADSALERFLGGFRQCDYANEDTPFDRFAGTLAEKYTNAFSPQPGPTANRGDIVVALPGELKGAVGREGVVNHGEYTAVTVPLTGTFGGIPLSRIEFVFGNENGINAAVLVFDAPRAAVAKAFGAAVARGARRGQEAARDGAGYSAAIPKDEPGRIVCDWST